MPRSSRVVGAGPSASLQSRSSCPACCARISARHGLFGLRMAGLGRVTVVAWPCYDCVFGSVIVVALAVLRSWLGRVMIVVFGSVIVVAGPCYDCVFGSVIVVALAVLWL